MSQQKASKGKSPQAQQQKQQPAGGKAPTAQKAPAASKEPGPMQGQEPAVKLPQPVQKKGVAVGKEDDPAEREAEQVARKVTAGEQAPKVSTPAPAEKDGPARKLPAGEDAAATEAVASKGPGKPLPDGTRKSLERSMGADMGGVRVHDDAAAQASARDLNARAFTHGSDIWLGPGESADDVGLMAHETAHVMQQGGAVRKNPTGSAPAGGTGAPSGTGGAGGVDDPGTLINPTTIQFQKLQMTDWKAGNHNSSGMAIQRAAGYSVASRPSGSDDQKRVWENNIDTTAVTTMLEDKVKAAYRITDVGQRTYRFGAPGNQVYRGRPATVAKKISRPRWDARRTPKQFDVDHKHELQLGGSNQIGNMELVYNSVNSSSGSRIDAAVNQKVAGFIQHHNRTESAEEIKAAHRLVFDRAEGGGGGRSPTALDKWDQGQIERGEHVGPVVALPDTPGAGRVMISLDGMGGGGGMEFESGGSVTGAEAGFLAPFTITAKNITLPDDGAATATGGTGAAAGGSLGSLTFAMRDGNPLFKPAGPTQVNIIKDSDLAGHVDASALQTALGALELKSLSPVRINSFEMGEDGMVARGQVDPTLSLIQGAAVDLEVNGTSARIFKTFDTGSFHLPRPFQVRGSSLTVFGDTADGVGLSGQIDFGIDRVGEGSLQAEASTRGGIRLGGRFNLDSDLFETAEVGVRYDGAQDRLSGTANLQLARGRVRGVRSGSVQISIDRDRFEATGTVEPSIPGVRQAAIQVRHEEGQGLVIGGRLDLADNIPGIRGGSVQAELRQGEGGYELSATGTAEPAIPGVTGEVTVGYNQGTFTAGATLGYRRGNLSGEVTINVTNGGEGERLRASGGGSVTLQVAPWLQGTVGINLREDGTTDISGEVALPSAVDIFDKKEFNKNILRMPTLDIPIVGVAAAGQRIGIFATIGGGLDANASIGPGQLQDMRLGVQFNPDDPAATHVTGHAALNVPAEAGLRLYARGGIGAGIPIVSATANLEVGGKLGLEGAARAEVNVDWTPARGLVLDATGSIMVQPKFVFDITGSVMVTADLLVTSVELYSKRWTLASFEYGSGMQFGVEFPVHYEEGKPFNISLDDIRFITPEVDPMSIVRDLIGRQSGGGGGERM